MNSVAMSNSTWSFVTYDAMFMSLWLWSVRSSDVRTEMSRLSLVAQAAAAVICVSACSSAVGPASIPNVLSLVQQRNTTGSAPVMDARTDWLKECRDAFAGAGQPQKPPPSDSPSTVAICGLDTTRDITIDIRYLIPAEVANWESLFPREGPSRCPSGADVPQRLIVVSADKTFAEADLSACHR